VNGGRTRQEPDGTAPNCLLVGQRARVLGGLGAVAVVVGLVVVVPDAGAAPEPAEGTLTVDQRSVEWTGSFTAPAIVYPSGCDAEFCDQFALTVEVADRPADLTVVVEQPGQLTVPVVEILDAEGEVLAEGVGVGGITLEVEGITTGSYVVQVTNGDALPNGTYTGTASIVPGQAPFDPSAETVRYDFDETAPVGAVDAPLRVVMVGFEPDSVEAERIFAEIPDHQRVGVLNAYGGATRNGDDSVAGIGGNQTLLNHGRVFYDQSEPNLLPVEYRWHPELHYAPAAFTRGLFEAMLANSETGDYSNPVHRAYLDAYNASRGSAYRVAASGDPAQAVAPGAPVRFIDGEATEDWINANAEPHLGFPAGRDPGQPGYTVFVINTWDSPEAQELFPAGEYHAFRINRVDPDREDFDGIDWARIWGGRYRFMMVDLGAAPNAYESESWGNRSRDLLGSAAYDPPLWEYRANAPRPVTLVDAVGQGGSFEQGITPGATWDDEALQHLLARTVNEAVNYRFFHSYLYEPRPGTGRYFLSDNVWHDATTLYRSDLEALYDQQAAIQGLETLAPSLDFEGDVVYQYLDQTAEHPEYAEDQAALDQAKQDGDDVAGAPHVSMHTDTMMDYIDSQPERFLRGGECSSTVPTIQVVVPGHYAWALPVAAGIATNRNGVPWGFLNSVNDATKWSGADAEGGVPVHPDYYSGTFTYTTIHEASHYLGLAHPHDTVGATRNEDGTPRYYDGFAWTFNSTASPTTYSHVETAYSILDQESIARGHFSYYIEWTGEALEESGQAWSERGIDTIGQLPARAAELRSIATTGIREARWHFSQFRFVDASAAAQRAWRAAAEYRDLALEQPIGTSQVERGTQLGTDDEIAANGCPSVEETPVSPAFDPGPAPRAADGGFVHLDTPETPPHVHNPDGTTTYLDQQPAASGGAAAAAERAVSGRTASSDRPAPAGGPPLAAAGLAVALIVGVLRTLARRAWT
jgi:hypothetical protein